MSDGSEHDLIALADGTIAPGSTGGILYIEPIAAPTGHHTIYSATPELSARGLVYTHGVGQVINGGPIHGRMYYENKSCAAFTYRRGDKIGILTLKKTPSLSMDRFLGKRNPERSVVSEHDLITLTDGTITHRGDKIGILVSEKHEDPPTEIPQSPPDDAPADLDCVIL